MGRPQHFLYSMVDPHQHGAFRGGGQLMAWPSAMISLMQARRVSESVGSPPVRVV